MSQSTPRHSCWILGLTAALAFLPCFAAHAAPELTLAEAKSALVDLTALWGRATNGVPLGEVYLNSYLTAAQPAGGMAVVPVAADDARELYRRQAFLSLYVKKHASFVDLVQSGSVPASVPMDATEVSGFAQKARAAALELYLIAWISLAEGDTLEQKCAAHARATKHGQTLGFGGSTQLPEADLPAAWRALYARARQVNDSQATRFRAALCSEGSPAAAGARKALEGLLDAKLDQTLGQHFDRTAVDLERAQQSSTDLLNASQVQVPREGLLALQKRVMDARSVHALVKDDSYGLGARIAQLSEQTAALLTSLQGHESADAAFAAPRRELVALRATLSAYLALAKSLASLRFLAASDTAAIAACGALPERVELLSPGFDLSAAVNTCLSAALSIRARLFATPSTPPERVALLRHLESLSAAFLKSNGFAPAPESNLSLLRSH